MAERDTRLNITPIALVVRSTMRHYRCHPRKALGPIRATSILTNKTSDTAHSISPLSPSQSKPPADKAIHTAGQLHPANSSLPPAVELTFLILASDLHPYLASRSEPLRAL